jgi:hypothetical protein
MSERWLSELVKLARWVVYALLFCIPILCLLSPGALGEEDDASGPILFIWPVSAIFSLVILRCFRDRFSAWLLAFLVITGPVWSILFFGIASKKHLDPFWAELTVFATWPLWGLVGFRQLAKRT